MVNIIKSVCVIIGATIGAGFASGKEIYIFFNIYGVKGIVGIAIASILTGIIIYKVLMHIRNEKIENYHEYIEKLGINKKINNILTIVINMFLLMSFYIMIAGFCAYFKQEFNISSFLVSIFVSFVCYLIFMNSIDGITKINTICIPILILLIIMLGKKNGFVSIEDFLLKSQNISDYSKINRNWLIASMEYASYNSILLIPILIGLKKYSIHKEKIISIISSVLLFGMAIILYNVLLSGGVYINNIDLPLIYIANKFGSIYKYSYGAVIVCAIFTTAVAAGYGFIQNSTKTKKGHKAMSCFICVSSILISSIGFSDLVNLLYPAFGMLSLLQLFFILKKKA